MTVRKFLIAILVLAFIVRVAAMLVLQSWIFPSEREFGMEEGEIAYALANGQGFSWPQTWREVGTQGAMAKHDQPDPTAWKAPIDPAIISISFRIFGSYSAKAAAALELFQVSLSILSCLLLFRLGRMLFNDWTGLIAALIFAVYPASIHFAVQKIEYPTLLTFLGLLLIHQTIVFSKRPTTAGELTLGALSGIAALVNPVILAFLPFALLWLMWTRRGEWRTRLKSVVTIGGCCVLAIAPWLTRNYLVFDRFVFIKSNFARELVNSNFPDDGRALKREHPHASGNDGHVSTLFTQEAVNLILERPAVFSGKVAARFPRFWIYVGEAKGRMLLLVGTAYYSMLCLGLAGVWIALRRRQAQLPMIYLLTMPIPFYLTWAARARFRFPIEPIIVLFASYAVTTLLSRQLPGFRKQSNQHS